MHAGAVMGDRPASHAVPVLLSALFWEEASMCVFLMTRVQASHTPPVSPTGSPTRQCDSSSWSRIPGLGCPLYGLNCSLPREDLHPRYPAPTSEFPFRSTGPNLIASLSLLPKSVLISSSLGCVEIFLPSSS